MLEMKLRSNSSILNFLYVLHWISSFIIHKIIDTISIVSIILNNFARARNTSIVMIWWIQANDYRMASRNWDTSYL